MSYQPSKTLHESIDYVSGTEYLEFNSYKIIDYRNSIIDEISKFYNININIINEICNKIGDDSKEHMWYPSTGSGRSPSSISLSIKNEKTIINNRNTFTSSWSSNNLEALINYRRIIKYNEKKCNDLVNLINENSIKLIEFNDKINKIVEYINMLRTRYSEIVEVTYCCEYNYIVKLCIPCTSQPYLYKGCTFQRCLYKHILKQEDIINNHYDEILNLYMEDIIINDIPLSSRKLINIGTKPKILRSRQYYTPARDDEYEDIYNELFFGIDGKKDWYLYESKGPKEDKINKMIEVSNNYINYDESKAIIFMFAHESYENPTNTNLPFIKNSVSYSYIFNHWQQYFNSNDGNTLLALQVMNKFATENKIRIEDAINIFREYMQKDGPSIKKKKIKNEPRLIDFSKQELIKEQTEIIDEYNLIDFFSPQETIEDTTNSNKINKLLVPNTKRKPVPKQIREQLWIKHFGNTFNGKCYCCKKEFNFTGSWEAGHIIASANGGLDVIDNLSPICLPCNRSMGTEHLYEFKKRCYPTAE